LRNTFKTFIYVFYWIGGDTMVHGMHALLVGHTHDAHDRSYDASDSHDRSTVNHDKDWDHDWHVSFSHGSWLELQRLLQWLPFRWSRAVPREVTQQLVRWLHDRA